MLELATTLAALHFGAPALYLLYLRAAPKKPLQPAAIYPKVAVVVPTYNEARNIEAKLEDIYSQSYPRDRMSIYVVDSASTDGTAEAAERWAAGRKDVRVVVLREPERRGKAHALNTALAHLADEEVVVVTDADSRWLDRDTLRKAVAYLAAADAVSCLKKPAGGGPTEEAYRTWYNRLRLAESLVHSTPVFHGELAAFRREAIAGGFPEDVGADDSYAAIRIAIEGGRAVTPPDVWCIEAVPQRGYARWRLRRAQHLIQTFARALPKVAKAPPPYRAILAAEAYLHLFNPWLLPAAAALAAASGPPGLALLAAGAAALLYKPYRAWVAGQIYLMAAALRNIWNKELIWQKQEKPPP